MSKFNLGYEESKEFEIPLLPKNEEYMLGWIQGKIEIIHPEFAVSENNSIFNLTKEDEWIQDFILETESIEDDEYEDWLFGEDSK